MGPGGCSPGHRSGPDRRHAARAPPCWRGGAGGQPPLALPWTPWRCVTRQPSPRVVMTYFVHVARVANMAAAEGSSAGGPLFAGLADVSISEDIPVEGEITVPVGSHSPDEDYSTLDEPVRDTIVSLCLCLW